MCGIVGYVGNKDVLPVIMGGLRKLEYRGYDSAGVAIGAPSEGGLKVFRSPGKLHKLEELLHHESPAGTYGIGHTRWATHGRPTEQNAHPHQDCTGRIVVVHNGIVENFLELRAELTALGHKFVTETDTEIIPHLIEQVLNDAESEKTALSLEDAVRRAVARLKGAFALGVLSAADPETIVVARSGPPVVIGVGEGESFVASDIPGILHHTRDVYVLSDGDMGVLTRQGVRFSDFTGKPIERPITHIQWDPIQAEKGEYSHFMLKEIFEQPRAIHDTCAGRFSMDPVNVRFEDLAIEDRELAAMSRVQIAACGTSWNAALVGKYMIERLARVPVEVDYGSEYRYRDPIPTPDTLGIVITQSGETADTLAAQRQMNALGSKTVAICNVVGAMITRDAHGSIHGDRVRMGPHRCDLSIHDGDQLLDREAVRLSPYALFGPHVGHVTEGDSAPFKLSTISGHHEIGTCSDFLVKTSRFYRKTAQIPLRRPGTIQQEPT